MHRRIKYLPVFFHLCVLVFSIQQKVGYVTLSCIDLVNSTCPSFYTSRWNKDNIGESLKQWIGSVEPLPLSESKKNQHMSHQRKIQKHPRTKVLTFIGRIDCISNKVDGPIWKIGGLTSKRQFHNGFFYGHLDENEELTG